MSWTDDDTTNEATFNRCPHHNTDVSPAGDIICARCNLCIGHTDLKDQANPVTKSATETIEMARWACVSEDGLFRYSLWRRWSPGKTVLFCMLNPSTADALDDDPTIRRCIGFARAWGYGALGVTNVFAFRATNPDDLLARAKAGLEVFGSRYIPHHLAALNAADLVIAAWGAAGNTYPLIRAAKASTLRLLSEHGPVHHLGLTKEGSPKHPLYLSSAVTPQELEGAGVSSE